MEALSTFVMIVAVITAATTKFNVQRWLFAAGHGWFRSTVVSGFTGFLAAIGIIIAYFIAGYLIGKLLQ